MQRKLIQIAKSTKVISLPREWIEQNKLVKGDSIELEIRNNDLIIRGKPQKKQCFPRFYRLFRGLNMAPFNLFIQKGH